jgi:hypothetical protein
MNTLPWARFSCPSPPKPHCSFLFSRWMGQYIPARTTDMSTSRLSRMCTVTVIRPHWNYSLFHFLSSIHLHHFSCCASPLMVGKPIWVCTVAYAMLLPCSDSLADAVYSSLWHGSCVQLPLFLLICCAHIS